MLYLLLAIAAVVAFEIWGRRPVYTPLTDMRLLNGGIVYVIRRGQHGAFLSLSWPGRHETIFATKQLATNGEITIEVREEGAQDSTGASVHHVRAEDFIDQDTDTPACRDAIRRIRGDIEARTTRLHLALVPDGVIMLRGILALNVPRATGIPRRPGG